MPNSLTIDWHHVSSVPLKLQSDKLPSKFVLKMMLVDAWPNEISELNLSEKVIILTHETLSDYIICLNIKLSNLVPKSSEEHLKGIVVYLLLPLEENIFTLSVHSALDNWSLFVNSVPTINWQIL